MDSTQKEEMRAKVRQGYAGIALGSTQSCCGSGQGCCSSANAGTLAASLGYSEDDINDLPEGVNMGLSCGNPLALASLKEGDVVLDLGSGGGFDVFQAGPRVGKSGRVIGVDMTAEMLHKARNACVWYREHSGLDNVEFRLGEIEHLPVADNSVDVVLSNCVINLSPDKPQVWKEIFRVLRSGGKVSVSDIVLLEELPENVMDSVAALVSCISGAILLEETKNILKECGFIHISLDKKSGYIEAMESGDDPLYAKIRQSLPPEKTLHDVMTSAIVSAQKP